MTFKTLEEMKNRLTNGLLYFRTILKYARYFLRITLSQYCDYCSSCGSIRSGCARVLILTTLLQKGPFAMVFAMLLYNKLEMIQ